MLLHTLSFLAAFPVIGVFSGQVPVVDGVLGGVPIVSTSKPQVLEETSTAATTPGALRVTENSGVCETTPGVYQASGYGDLTATESIWFWFFAARNNSDKAPLALWFNGGPGSSSMLGLFQELGPCRISNDSSTVSLNPFSWNNEANVLFIDQPVGVGFSHGDLKVGTSQAAAADVWSFLQIFFKDSRFSKFLANDLAIWTESYFLSQNEAIDAGTVSGFKLNLKVLGDPLSQYAGYITYAGSNPYHALVSSSTISRANTSWTSNSGCRAQALSLQITNCYNGGSNSVYYVLTANPDPYPPDIARYLASIRTQVGAEVSWQETNENVYRNFASTGDWMRNSRPNLETVINAGVRVIVYDGDADYILNFNGVEAMVNALQTKFTSLYQQQQHENFTVNGQVAGIYKNAGTFSYIRIFGAGHEVPAYKFGTLAVGQTAAQMFTQIMRNQSLTPT
ncbi:hypothetical protein C0995_013867 [Termitomyces sp. Mi166|nr:hypothetical protein C0995_013867 [Termitomyces sp. Mi166\